jgi:hypothetical protein
MYKPPLYMYISAVAPFVTGASTPTPRTFISTICGRPVDSARSTFYPSGNDLCNRTAEARKDILIKKVVMRPRVVPSTDYGEAQTVHK